MDRGRHGHVVLFVMCFQHLFLEQEVHPVSDNQCYKLDEDLCMQRLIGLAAYSSVTEEGFIFPEEFFGCIPALIEIECIADLAKMFRAISIEFFCFFHSLTVLFAIPACDAKSFCFILPDAFHALFSEQNRHVHHDLSLPDNTLFSTSISVVHCFSA